MLTMFRSTMGWVAVWAAVVLANPLALAQDDTLQQRLYQLEQQVKRLTLEVEILKTQLRLAQVSAPLPHQADQGDSTPDQEHVGPGAGDVSFFGIQSWLVQIVKNQEINSDLHTQLSATHDQLASINQRIEKAHHHLNEVSQKRPVLDLYLGKEVMQPIHPQATIDQAESAVQLLAQQQRAAQNQMAQLKRRIAADESTRRVTGQTRDGRQVKLIALGPNADLVAGMQPGQWYRVAGTGNDDNGAIRITVKTVTSHNPTP